MSRKEQEQQWEDSLKALAEEEMDELKLPESLKPEKIKEKILEYEKQQTEASSERTEQSTMAEPEEPMQSEAAGTAEPTKVRRFTGRWKKSAGIVIGVAAAALVLAVGTMNSDLWRITSGSTGNGAAQTEDAKAEDGLAESDDTVDISTEMENSENAGLSEDVTVSATTEQLSPEELRARRENLDGVRRMDDYSELFDFFQESGLVQYREKEKITFWDKLRNIFYGATKDVAMEEEIVLEDAMPESAVEDGGMNFGANSSTATTTTTTDSDDAVVNEVAESATETGAEKDYSDTNVQEQGVDESDIIKTDGRYIYRLSNNYDEIVIYQADGARVTLAGTIKLEPYAGEGHRSYRDMLLMNGRLAVLGSVTVYSDPVEIRPMDDIEVYNDVVEDEDVEASEDIDIIEEPVADVIYPGDMYYRSHITYTELTVYDVSDPAAPAKIDTRTQEGNYQGVRMVDGIIYLVSYKSNSGYFTCDEGEEEAYFTECYIPRVDGEMLPCDHIYVPEEPGTPSCVIITSTDIMDPHQHLDSVAVLGDATQMYVSNSSIYLWQTEWSWWTREESNPETMTTIMKYSYADGVLSAAGKAELQGYLNNSFSLSEYDGHLRLVTTREYEKVITKTDDLVESEWTTENMLFVLNEKMQLVGKIEDLAAGEYVKSARFFGDIGYFVTFRQTDPLFSVDLSDPTNPRIIGTLKIPGFSEYLHPYGEGLLLGIGQEADENTGGTEGVKLSMFDVSDPTNVKEIAKCLVRDVEYSYSDAEYNHKAILASASRNVIGFSLEWGGYVNEEWGTDWTNGYEYCVYSYDPEQGFVELLAHDFGEWENQYNCRGIYIGEYLYLVYGNRQVMVYNMNDWTLCGEYDFR